ncbi:MAG: hypothetical protein RMK29_09530 [Myxococcales bacterium]|nr:hypothetical protein [Myxococcota bacterium]MDW8281941.1 hypothetical protein [Myxococcales bacterium]
MSQDLRPQQGVRFELEWLGMEQQSVRYRACLHLPQARHEYTLRIVLPGGTCTLAEVGHDPPGAPAPSASVLEHLLRLGRQLYRDAQRDGTWKRRVLRWRDLE